MAEYTHDFKLEFNGNSYTGQVEFNEDGIASYQFDDSYSLSVEQSELVNLLMKLWHKMYHSFGESIKLIRLKEKSEG